MVSRTHKLDIFSDGDISPELNLYCVKPRWRYIENQPVPPATEALRQIQPNGNLGGIDVFPLESEWVEYMKSLNPESWRKIFIPWAGVFNYTKDPDWYDNGVIPMFNAVAFDFNVVNVTDIRNGIAYIETLDVHKPVPHYTRASHPHLIHQFYSITSRNEPRLLGSGYVAYVPLMTEFQCGLPFELLEKYDGVLCDGGIIP